MNFKATMNLKQLWKRVCSRTARKRSRHSRINALEPLEPRHLLTGTPTIFIDDSSASEGANEIFRIWLSEPTDQDVAVDYSTSNGTAIGNTDYVPASGTAVIPAAATEVNVTVSTIGNPAADGDKEFYVTLSNPINGELNASDWEATGSIIDATPLVTVESASGSEGQELVFNISLSVPSAGYILVSYSSSNKSIIGRAINYNLEGRGLNAWNCDGTDFWSLSGAVAELLRILEKGLTTTAI